ncbi:ERMES complex subunit [Tilletia horrida]|uniref:Mitochondrial distribution and morphology protein 34 n=1 Tax=Tilletia horrida TaxID=155126 RepID=A0AAN6JNT6_9BASI|nr:ERMES complex subunit [Tilletia horrida]KAK0548238.1 ERMES complex subunit [Tilletia horrida]KAK0560219.1 ERMES complex subunit [Tilletia horrida]
MSFRFQWPEFGPDFHAHAASMLNSALNRGPRPKVIADDIRVKELNMGTIPPELDILEIGDLTTDRFRGIFRLTYEGDAHLILSTKVQANPLSRPPAKPELSIFRSNTTSSAASAARGILFAASPLIVPMHLRLSQVRLRAIVVLVVSKTKGVTLVFKNDPLESVDVSSTFDGVAVIQKYLQQEIEGQLREMFREDLPGIIHRLSQSWLARSREPPPASTTTPSSKPDSEQVPQKHDADTTVGATASDSSSAMAIPRSNHSSGGATDSVAGTNSTAVGVLSSSPSTLPSLPPTAVSLAPAAAAAASLPRSPVSPSPAARIRATVSRAMSASTFTSRTTSSRTRVDSRADGPTASQPHRPPEEQSASAALHAHLIPDTDDASSLTLRDIEEYDPTYGLRPDEVDLNRSLLKSGFSGLGKLMQGGHEGLGGLQPFREEHYDDYDDDYDYDDLEDEEEDDREGGGAAGGEESDRSRRPSDLDSEGGESEFWGLSR